jgi:hypothetical protein
MDFAGFWSSEDGDEYLEDLHEQYELPHYERNDLYKRIDDEWDLSNQFAEWDEDEEEVDLTDLSPNTV